MLVDFHGLHKRYAQDISRFAFYLSGDSSLAEGRLAEELRDYGLDRRDLLGRLLRATGYGAAEGVSGNCWDAGPR